MIAQNTQVSKTHYSTLPVINGQGTQKVHRLRYSKALTSVGKSRAQARAKRTGFGPGQAFLGPAQPAGHGIR